MRQEAGTFAPGSTIAVTCTLAAAAEDFIGLAVDDDATELGLASELIADVGRALHASDIAAEGEHFNLDAELISGRDLLAELAFINAGEEDQLRIRLEFAHDQQPASLCHGFYDEHSGHDRMTGEVAGEIGLVHGHGFQCADALARLHAGDTVYQQERITMRQDLLDLLNVERDPAGSGRGDSGMS